MGVERSVSVIITSWQASKTNVKRADAYLSAHYELLREDATRPLRYAICNVRKEPDLNEDAFSGTIGIYQDVCSRLTTPQP